VFIINHLIARNGEAHGMPNGQTYNTNFARYNEAVRQVAKSLKAPSIDLPQIMQAQNVSVDSLVSEDGLHLSVRGNHLYAAMVFERLKQIL
jgi:lysophospholipase L1-like esterase